MRAKRHPGMFDPTRADKHLGDVQTLPARGPLPDVIVNLVGKRLGGILRKQRPRQRFP